MPEIDENQLAAFRAYDDFYRKASSNASHRKLLKQLEKAVYPDAAVPEIDAADAVTAALDDKLKAITDRIDGFTKSLEERDSRAKEDEIKARWANGQRYVREAGYTTEGLADLEKFMQERGIFDHDIALPAYERLHPPAEPATVGNGERWNFFDVPKDDEAIKQLLETNNDEVFLREMIPAALRDVRGK